MANLITSCRLLLLVVVILLLYFGTAPLQILNLFLLIMVFVTDGLDGYVARKYHEESLFGAIYDIAADRIVELCLWIVFAHLGVIPVWIPLVFVGRGVLTDAIRAAESEREQRAPFATIQSPVGQMLVAGRFMRIFYAVLKAVTFCVLLITLPLPALLPTLWQDFGHLVTGLGLGLAYASVLICILRGVPVIVEFMAQQRAQQ